MNTLHPDSLKTLISVAKRRPHAILISGNAGSDFTEALRVLEKNLGSKNLLVDSQSYASAKEIRALYELTRTKTMSSTSVVIENADRLSPAAQNALLKLLEEPNENYIFILLSSSPNELFATVRSRLQAIRLLPITDSQVSSLLDELRVTNATKRSQITFLADGQPGEIAKLATDKEYFENRATIMRDAKRLLQERAYEAAKLVSTYKDRRDDCLELLHYAAKIITQTLANKSSDAPLKNLDDIIKASNAIKHNGNVRLALLTVVV